MSGTKVDVVAAIIEREGRFLLGKRSAHRPKAPGYWCPISGRVEAGESHAEAVVREVREETALAVEALEKVAECDTHDGSARIHWWRVRLLNDTPARLANDEHSELAWVTLEAMRRLEPVFLEDVEILERAALAAPAASRVAAAYDRWARRYDVDPNRTRVLAGEVLRQAPLEIRGRHVVEVGCGTGRNSAWLAEHAARVTALDISEGMLAEARAHVGAPTVTFSRHDINRPWPLADRSADVLVGMLVLEHIQALGPVLDQAARVLVPAGALFLCELHPTRQMLGKQARFGQPGGSIECITAFPHDVSDYVNAARAAGFTLEHLGEWRDAGADFQTPPRLLSAVFSVSNSQPRASRVLI
jgi:ubiquinone/menaquinone biosynthesis C-methylase UbiE/8-oxo-dGTP pyrophosphatase MutT (NUDIX family)